MSDIAELGTDLRDWLALLKPRVMTLVVFTGAIGLFIAPVHVHPLVAAITILSIAIATGGAGAINMWYDRDIDALMRRTASRPVPAGRIEAADALAYGIGLSLFSVALLWLATNLVAALSLAFSILFYVLVYTMWLKRSTPQNIVIGGAAGASRRSSAGPPPPARSACCRCCCSQSCSSGRRRISGRSRSTPARTTAPPACRCSRSSRRPPHPPADPALHRAAHPGLAFAVGAASDRPDLSGRDRPARCRLPGLRLARAARPATAGWHQPDQRQARRQTFRFSLLYLAGLFVAVCADRLIGPALFG